MDPVKTYDYLVKAREKVFDAVRALTSGEYLQPFQFGHKSIGSTFAHIMVTEWYYIERLEGRHVEPSEKWPIQYETPPAADRLELMWRDQGRRARGSIAAQRDWNRKLHWLSFPDDTRGKKRFHITCTAGDLVTQLLLHEVHHRAQIMAMFRELGKPLEDLDYNALMFDRRPSDE
jgi:uncharacterized damage-inducible protein DinB